jgi:ABC-type glycerol-3-phosphate transport system substrate-binding protein
MAGNPPDISLMGSGWTQMLAGAGALVEVSPLINEMGGQSAFFRMGLELGYYENGYYGIPFYVAPQFAVYQRSALQAAGMSRPPTTWEEYYNLAVRSTDRSRNVFGFGKVMNGPQSSIALWPFFQSNDVNLVNVDRNGNWFIDVDAAARNRLIETYDFLFRLMRDASPEGVLTYTQQELRNLVGNGIILSRLDTLEVFYDFKTRGNMAAFENVTIYPVPGRVRQATSTGGANLGILSRGNTALGTDYLRWIFEGDRLVDFYLSYPYALVPVRYDMIRSPVYHARLPDELKPVFPDIVMEALNSASFLMFANGPFPFAGEVETQQLLARPIIEMFNRGITAAQAADLLISDLQNLLR